MGILESMKKPEDITGTSHVKPQEPVRQSEVGYNDSSGKFLINGEGLALVKHFEGCYLKAYLDSVKVPTIGWGTIVYPSGKKVKLGDTCTQAEADSWLLLQLYTEAAKYVRAYLTNEDALSENAFSALVSFTYNRGAGRFRDYIAGHINNGDAPGAFAALREVNWAGTDHKYLLGLDRRRWAEFYLATGKDWRAFDSVEKFKSFKARGYR